jgi:LacI family transcriptional regulator
MLAKLAEKGYKRLFFVSGDMGYHHASAQKLALKRALEKRGCGIEFAGELSGNYRRRSGYAAAGKIVPIAKRGDCVFLSNDRMAAGFYRYCNEHGVSIPKDVGVVGSDNDEAAQMLYPDLTTIYQPRVEMGETAVEMVVDMLNGKQPETVVLPKKFILRNSV